jgi:uncharacterized membrane protein (DUF373 family)
MQENVKKSRLLGDLRDQWPLLTMYERFEQIVAIILSLIIVSIILTALWGLGMQTADLMRKGAFATPGIHAFQAVFGTTMTLLIAMEFNHSLFHSVLHRGQIIKVKTVILIAMLAIARKFIVMQAEKTTALTIFAYSVAVLFLGVVYWLMDTRENPAIGINTFGKTE